VRGVAAVDVEVAAGDGSGDEEGSGFDAVGVDAMARAVEFGDALNADGGGACAFDLCAHGDEQGGEVGDFGLAGAVFEEGFAFGEDGGHEEVFGAGDGDLVEDDVRAFEAVGAGFEVAVLLGDGGAHGFEALMCRSMGRPPMAQPPGMATRAMPVRAMSGPRTSELARMVLTISYLATGSERMAHLMWCGAGRGRSRVRPRRPC
jgi:hypothetical protein